MRKRLEEKEYKIRWKDLAPLTGLINYADRCEKEASGNFKEDMIYSLKIISRQYLLALYNVSIVTILTCSIAGLEKVFSQ